MKLKLTTTLAVSLAALALTSGCAQNSSSTATGEVDQFRYMVPNSAGSGWDTTARTAAKSMDDAKITKRIDVFNVDGANGTVGLSRLVAEKGNAGIVMQMGLGLVAATVTQGSKSTFDDTTPIAKLIDDYEIVVVPKGSPFDTLEELVTAWKADPGLKIGGGSAIGGADHITPLLMAQANDIDTTEVNYVSFGGSGVIPAILGKQVDFGVTSISDSVELVKAGQLKALAVSGPEPTSTLPDVPTLKDGGTDVVFANWRGVVAPPGLSEKETKSLVAVFDKMHESAQWKKALETNAWTDSYMTGAKFESYLKEQRIQVAEAMKGLDQ